jgi:hypothetical protein
VNFVRHIGVGGKSWRKTEGWILLLLTRRATRSAPARDVMQLDAQRVHRVVGLRHELIERLIGRETDLQHAPLQPEEVARARPEHGVDGFGVSSFETVHGALRHQR